MKTIENTAITKVCGVFAVRGINMRKRRFMIEMNSPVVLWITFISLALLLFDIFMRTNMFMMLGARRTHFADPMQYVRVFTHIFVHADLSHYVANFMMILVIGPMVEEKYGSDRLCWITIITALITGLIFVIFFPGGVLGGASGIVFMLILMASFTSIRQGSLPITVLLVGVLYIGNEILLGLFVSDNISRISHIVGALCGATFGFVYQVRKHR